MLSTLLIVLPIFALVLAGWLARRIGVLGPNATTELNRFVVYLALPALLFDITSHAHWSDLWQPGFIAVFGISTLLIFTVTVAARLRSPRHLADAAIDGLNAGYANTAYMGFPITLAVLGQQALAPTTIASIITVCVVFAIAIVLIEVGLQSEARALHLARKVGLSLMRNPLLVAPVLGALFPASGLTVPVPVETFLKMLGGAASPCALVALGLFLAAKTEQEADITRSTAMLVGLKLVLHPIIAWVLASMVFHLSPTLTRTVVLLAALPTGTGPFMLAEFYAREAAVTSRVILVSTMISVLTVSAYLAMSA
ncbi:AEC family transporter [Hyphomicrobium sp. MC1]|uniref:AEC family transporter n=1 Tax=Hyphomicrobium sp. (strain MC1) TaxID=717785 RepID=UPI000213E624|nr:AEC family transporter [Hyphomicrobium sp. MC1]CCB64658.1 Auxin Efflux Carrier [Hyphomicrobium sp. MC1]